MKKHLAQIAAVLALTVFLVAAALAAPADPAAVLDAAVQKNATLTDMDTSAVLEMHMTETGETMTMTTEMDMKITGSNTEDMVYVADTTMNIDFAGQAQSVDMSMFYTDGYCYSDTMGQKLKYPMDLPSVMKAVEQSTSTAELSSELMTNLSMKKENGQTMISFVADPALMNDTLQDSFSMLTDQLAALGDFDMEFQDVQGIYTINPDGYYSAVDMTMVYTVTVQGITFQADYIIHMDIHNPGQPVEITLPDTEGYTEIS